MLIMNRDEACVILLHLYAVRRYYQNQAELFKGSRSGSIFVRYMKEVDDLINGMEAELQNES